MRFSPRTWSLLSIMLFIAAAFFWMKGNEYEARKRKQAPTNAVPAAAVDLLAPKASGVPLAQLGAPAAVPDSSEEAKLYPLRLRNTDRSMNELLNDDRAVLLANALIDTAGRPIEIPEHLRAAEDPGTHIVQWNGPANAEFRALLANHGAQIVSYVPNNAYLVKAGKTEIEKLKAAPGVQAAFPFEPYYKLEQSLLALAVDNAPLPEEALLRLTLVPGTREGAAQEVARLGGAVLADEESPFGPQVIIQPAPFSLAALARLGSVQGIEPDLSRKPAADLARLVLGVSGISTNTTNYLNLTGSNVWVNINDTGIDTNHPGLVASSFTAPPPPVRTNILNSDPEGHGTFVAGLIVGSGNQGPIDTNAPYGSDTNASFRGLAPQARVFAQPINPAGEELYPKVKDTWLIQNAAATNYLTLRRTNTLISNNSWTYGAAAYDSAAARYDAAVRDAIAGSTGAQPLLFVFAAGNSGFGDDEGGGGQIGRIESPGTAKNVITVGALESRRLIEVGFTNYATNYFTNIDNTIETNVFEEPSFPFIRETDSSNQVAYYSSRGNVGIGIEGSFGRFKPDVVAPGSMLISLRSEGWNITNSVDTNTQFGEAFAAANTNLGRYRFDSGTTYAAANVSGFLALVQEYFERMAPTAQRGRLSPALMKALLVNGSRSLTEFYDLAVQAAANFQGWGLPHLPSTLSSFSTNGHQSLPENQLRLRFVDQNPENALATSESRTWRIKLSTNAQVYPLRVTLVWTDPPGNPAVGVKLVNDLDLVITNVETRTVFYGNNFFPGSDFTEATTDTNAPAVRDSVNNVENVFIRNPRQFGEEFTITVRGRRVNVNALPDHLAVTGRTNDVVQDFALVIASDIGSDPAVNTDGVDLAETEVFTEFTAPTDRTIHEMPAIGVITNGLPLLTERVGANPTQVGTNGIPAQWNFYVFTNSTISNAFVNIRAGRNLAFVTFNPPNLSRPRNEEADIDLYVSADPRLTNLHAAVIATALKSTNQGGTETVVFTNGVIDQVYYIGVKSEDQQGAEFSLMGVSREGPFEEDRNGKSVLVAVPISSTVLDGSANRPSAATLIAIGVSNRRAARVQAETRLTHGNIGDLVGVLAHTGVRTVLNNHTLTDINNQFSGTNLVLAYNDSGYFETAVIPEAPSLDFARPSDGPGSLNDFAGTKVVGSWIFEMIDNAPGHTGRVDGFTIVIDPLQNSLLSGQFIDATNRPFETLYFPIDVPASVTNLTVDFSRVSPGPLDVMLRDGSLPTTNQFDFRTNIVAPGGVFVFPTTNSLPLHPGTYFLAVRNPLNAPNSYRLMVTFGFDNSLTNRYNFSGGNIPVRDDALSSQTIPVFDDKLVASVQVGVNMRHPRASDTVLSLLSPQGTRILLAEQRGYTNVSGFGTALRDTNGTVQTTYYTMFTDDTNLATQPLKFIDLGRVTTSVGAGAIIITNGFEGARDTNYSAGQRISGGGWLVNSGLAGVFTGDAYSGSNVMSLGTRGTQVSTNFTAVSNGVYRVTFAVRTAAPIGTNYFFSTGVDDAGRVIPTRRVDPHYRLIQSPDPVFDGPEAFTIPPRTGWNPNTTNSLWIAATTNTTSRFGQYIYRTYVNMHEQNTAVAQLRLKWAAIDDLVSEVRLNGVPQTVLPVPPNAFNAAPFQTIPGIRAGLNTLDFVVEDNLGLLRVQVDRSNLVTRVKNPNPTMSVTLGRTTRTITASTNWTEYTFDVVATNANSQLLFAADAGEVWIDSVRVERSADIFVLPEEPLTLLQGERAAGDWTLEVRDARTGVILLPTDVLSWRLDLNFSEAPVRAERLFAGNNFPLTPVQVNPPNRMRGGILFTNQVHYFIIIPCPGAKQITVTLNGINNFDAIEMLADHSGIPTGDPERDDFVLMRNNENPGSPGGRITFRLTDSEPAPARMIAGKPFFVALRNRFINVTNLYTLRVDSDVQCLPVQPPPLPPNQTINSALAASSAGEATEGDTFEAEVATNASSVSFKVEAEGDAMIVAAKDSIPTRDSYSHIQNTAGSGSEELRITSNSEVPLSPGKWYIRVLNNSGGAIGYSITATGDLGSSQEAPPPVETSVTAALDGTSIRLEWNSAPGATYRVESSPDLINWSPVGAVTADGDTAEFSDELGASAGRFYRVRQ